MHDDENESSNCMVDFFFFFSPTFYQFRKLNLELEEV